MRVAEKAGVFTCAALVAGLLCLCGGCVPTGAARAQRRSADIPRFVTPRPPDAASREWERSLKAAYSAPMKAQVVVSRWADAAEAQEQRTVIDVINAPGGRYRHTYREPESARGRVTLSDGTTIYQYEPVLKTAMRRADPAAPDASLINFPTRLTHVMANETVILLGRPTRLITSSAMRPEGTVFLWERRWADRATGRSLKTETFSSSGRLMRRVVMTQADFPPCIAADVFKPDFPPTTRIIAATTPHAKNAAAEAQRLGMPSFAGEYRLQSALRPVAASAGSAATKPTTHLIYSDGTRTLSVFITEEPIAIGQELTPRPGEGWQALELAEDVRAFTRRIPEKGHTAVVWTKENRRYTLISRLPLEDVTPTARTLVVASAAITAPR